jgi:hypothetical protein
VLDDNQLAVESAANRGPSIIDDVVLPQQPYAAGDHFILSATNTTAGAIVLAYILDQKDL